VLLSLYTFISHDRRSIRRMALNFVASFAVTLGAIITGFVSPPIWNWIVSLSAPALVFLGAVICGVTLLLVPLKLWQTLKERHSFGRASLAGTPVDAASAPKDPKSMLNKKAIKEAALRARTEEFDV